MKEDRAHRYAVRNSSGKKDSHSALHVREITERLRRLDNLDGKEIFMFRTVLGYKLWTVLLQRSTTQYIWTRGEEVENEVKRHDPTRNAWFQKGVKNKRSFMISLQLCFERTIIVLTTTASAAYPVYAILSKRKVVNKKRIYHDCIPTAKLR